MVEGVFQHPAKASCGAWQGQNATVKLSSDKSVREPHLGCLSLLDRPAVLLQSSRPAIGQPGQTHTYRRTWLKTLLVTLRIETEFVLQFHKPLSDLRPSAVRHGGQRGVYVAIL